MNSSEINAILKFNQKTKPFFQGVYASDTLPIHITKLPILLICNTDPISKPGEHWVSIFISQKRKGEYFDSFGLPPSNQNIINFLKRNCKELKYNKHMIQSLFSNYCGQFCIMYVYHKANKKSLNFFLKLFNRKKPILNNNIVFKFFNKTLCNKTSCMNVFKRK